MATFNNGESGLSVRTKINNVLQHTDGTASELVINEAGADVNFRVESDTNANALFVDGGTGNVGIGTTAPSNKLTVDSGNNGVAGYIDINSQTVQRLRLGYAFEDTPSTQTAAIVAADSAGNLDLSSRGNSASAIQFYTSPGAGAAERMRIDSSGNVGIGTSSPVSKLHALVETAGTSDIQTVLTIERQTSGTAAAGLGSRISFLGELSTGFAGAAQAGVVAGWSDPAGGGVNDGYLAFETTLNNTLTERMRIDASGNVGIGTATPGSKLSIVGLPTSSAGLSAGDIWNDGGTLKIV